MSLTIPPLACWERPDRLRYITRGPDRLNSWHNLTTQHVKGLAPGQSVEAFLTSLKGKTLAFLTLHNLGEDLLIRSDVSAHEAIRTQFDKYAIFDESELIDIQAETFEIHIVARSAESLSTLREYFGGSTGDEAFVAPLAESPQALRIVDEQPLGRPGLTIIGPLPDRPEVDQAIRDAMAPEPVLELDPVLANYFRVAARWPVSGQDVATENLPQEIDRDRTALHFDKGCYIGQETVARLDALGHVNKILRLVEVLDANALENGLQGDDDGTTEPSEPSWTLQADGKAAGPVTSIATPPAGSGEPVLALAIIRVAYAETGTELDLLIGERTVGRVRVCDPAPRIIEVAR